jgi:hypothetical protein
MLYLRSDIDFQHAVDVYDEWFTPFARLRQRLEDRGIRFHPRRGDIGFADARDMPEADGPPLVLYDRTDGGYLWWVFQPRGDIARRWLASERVLGLLKLSRYLSPAAYNEPATDESLHAQRIRHASRGELSLPESPPRPLLDDRSYAKLTLCPGFWTFDACSPQAVWPLEIDALRRLDVFCSLTTRYACPAISWHRHRALRELSRVRVRRVFLGRGRVLSIRTYHEILRESRIVVSPWGWGETCFRDYEALLGGCVLIKPRTDFVETLLPLEAGRHYIPCEPDFSDVAERIEEVLAKWPSFREQRLRNREYALRAHDVDQQADDWAESIRRACGIVGALVSPRLVETQAAGTATLIAN